MKATKRAYMVKLVGRPLGCSIKAKSESEAIAKASKWLGKGDKTAVLIFSSSK